jgi:predicted RNA-binding Zn ribbon-like protein
MMATEQRQNQSRPKQGRDPDLPRLLGERLCLDFANSVEVPLSDAPQEFLHDYGDLVRWGRHVGLLSDDQVAELLDNAALRPAVAAETFARALALRAAIDHVFHAVAGDMEPDAPDLATLEREHLQALAHAHLAPTGTGFAWTWPDAPSHLDSVLWPIAWSALDLLTNGDLNRVKDCHGPGGCGWLFYDTSKNASRRWCSMEGCGTHVKMARYRARKRASHA